MVSGPRPKKLNWDSGACQVAGGHVVYCTVLSSRVHVSRPQLGREEMCLKGRFSLLCFRDCIGCVRSDPQHSTGESLFEDS